MSFLTTIRNAIFSPSQVSSDDKHAETAAPAVNATTPQSLASAVAGSSASFTKLATHAPVAADRAVAIANAEGIRGSAQRIRVALELAALAPDLSAEAIIKWTIAHAPASDAPARTIPSLSERAAEAQREADALGSSPDRIQASWDAAIAEAMKNHRMN